jgi:ATP-dependent RNA helicase DeaD
MNITTFSELGIPMDVVNKLSEFEINEPSPVQAEVIPAAMQGKDILAHSQTGTGKTLAYLLPILLGIDPEIKSLQKLILAPTQELAMQIVRESERYGEQRGIRVLALIGGASTKRQLEKLRLHPQLVVGTPGRIRELIETRKLKMHHVNSIVVDEVDQVFQLGAAGDVSRIIRSAMRDRQLVFLSATISKESAALVSSEMKEPVIVGIAPEQMTASGLEHYYFITEERDKPDTLRRLIRHYNPEKALVFVNTTEDIAAVEAKMNHLGISTQALYGDADKMARSGVLDRFRKGKFKVLVASDLAARGLDIEGLTMVINYDPPVDSEHYVHRAGRTGRMGRTGIVLSIITDRQAFIIKKFTKELQTPIGLRSMSSGKVIKPGEEISRTRNVSQNTNDKLIANVQNPSLNKPVKAEIVERPQPRVSSESITSGHSPEAPRKPARTSTGASKSERERVRKNKGAPKWLKNKPPRI